MGGADLAVARDTSAIDTNSAGLTQIRQRAFDNYLAVAFALDVSHADRFGNDALVDWDGALSSATLTARNPDNPNAPQVMENTARLDWQDQFVFALGAALDVTDRTTLRAGYNDGRNPIPEGDHSAAARHELRASCHGRHEPLDRQPAPGAGERTEFIAAHLMLSRRS